MFERLGLGKGVAGREGGPAKIQWFPSGMHSLAEITYYHSNSYLQGQYHGLSPGSLVLAVLGSLQISFIQNDNSSSAPVASNQKK